MDEDLRGLEREARARPDDRLVAWAHVQGLRRAGERRRVDEELWRLAREGDPRALDAFHAPRRALRAPPRLRRGELAIEGPVLGATHLGDGGALWTLTRTVLMQLSTLEERWSSRAVFAQPCMQDGDGARAYALVLDGSDLLRLDATTGEVLARAAAPGPRQDLTVLFDRAVAWSERGDELRLTGLDAGRELGRVLWTRDVPFDLGAVTRVQASDGADLVVVSSRTALVALDASTGARVWSAPSPIPGMPGSVMRWQDALVWVGHGVVGACVLALDPRTGAARTPLGLPDEVTGWLAPTVSLRGDLALVCGRGSEATERRRRTHLLLHDRRAGVVRWRAALERETFGAALADDAVYVAVHAERRLRLRVVDSATGAVRLEHEVEVEPFPDGADQRVHVLATDGAVVVITGREVVRFFEEPDLSPAPA